MKYYKLAHPDGWDFYTGHTINYRDNIGRRIVCPEYDKSLGLCSSGVIHASKNINDCFQGNTKIPVSAYVVSGRPVITSDTKDGFKSLTVIEEIIDLDTAFGWKYSEAINPIHPFQQDVEFNKSLVLELLKRWASVGASVWASVGASVGDSVWASVWASVWDSVWASVWDSVGDSVGASVRDSVWDSVGASVWASVRDSVGDSVRDSVWAYFGSLFPNIQRWKYIEHEDGIYPFQPAVDLWKMGIVPSFDGNVWRLHSGEDAHIILTLSRNKLRA